MANNTQLVPRVQMENLLKSNYWQDSLKRTLGENAGAFSTSLVELFAEDSQLSQCDPKAVIKQAMLAGSVNLPINKQIGFAYMTVFKNKGVPTPTLMISARGFIQLAMRTGQYKYLNADVVYDGELKSRNRLSGEINLDGTKVSNRVIGFFAHFETVFGFTKTLYMSVEEIAHHAKIYSKALTYDKITEEQLVALIQETAENGPKAGVVGWKGNPIAMGTKTVLKQLIYKFGPMAVEIAKAVAEDPDDGWDSAQAERDSANNEEKVTINVNDDAEEAQVVDTETGELFPVEDEDELK